MELIHRRGAEWRLFLTALALTCMGVVMVYSASSVAAQAQFHDGAFFLKRQFVYAVIGIAAMSLTWNIHYAKLRRWTLPLQEEGTVAELRLRGHGTGTVDHHDTHAGQRQGGQEQPPFRPAAMDQLHRAPGTAPAPASSASADTSSRKRPPRSR